MVIGRRALRAHKLHSCLRREVAHFCRIVGIDVLVITVYVNVSTRTVHEKYAAIFVMFEALQSPIRGHRLVLNVRGRRVVAMMITPILDDHGHLVER